MARGKKDLNTLSAQIGEAKQSLMMLKNQQEEIRKKIKEKEVEIEQLENQQKIETMSAIIKIAEGEGVSLDTLLSALQRDKTLISLIADEAKNDEDEEEDISEDTTDSSTDNNSSEPNNSSNEFSAAPTFSQHS